MKNFIHPLLAVILFFAFSCAENKNQENQGEADPEKVESTEHEKDHWSYAGETGPEHWAEVEKNSDCGGMHQSPVNIPTTETLLDTSYHSLLKIDYQPDTKIKRVINNGHSIQYDFERGDFLEIMEDSFHLLQIHFHEPSEHTIDGIRYPVEMHLVHINKDRKYLVLGIMAKQGLSSHTFEFLESFLPVQPGEDREINTNFDLNQSLPENRDFYFYHGSLTTPPCTESVDWIVFKDPISISMEQIEILKELMPLDNYRNIQPLNDRTVMRNFKQ
jgi:carbonic anhydrase